jgi:translation initiation factor 3 subunit D
MGDPNTIAAGTSGARRPGQQQQQQGKYGREPKEAFGAGSAGTFAYFHDEDEASFSLVDGAKSAAAKRGGASGGSGGGIGNMGRSGQFSRGGGVGGRGGARGGAAGGRGAQQAFGRGGGKARPQNRIGWKDWNKEQRTRDASVVIGSDWAVLEEIEFSRLSKLRLDVDTTDVETV